VFSLAIGRINVFWDDVLEDGVFLAIHHNHKANRLVGVLEGKERDKKQLVADMAPDKQQQVAFER
jgi:predicted metal-dependent enzyme (double-stranded beta helix superfamily)